MLAEMARPFWTGRHAADELGLDEIALRVHGQLGRVLVLTSAEGVPMVPVRQFVTVDGRVTVRAGLALVFTMLAGVDPWAVAVLTLSDALYDELGGRTVLDAVRDDDFDALFDLSVAAGREYGARFLAPDVHVARVLAGIDSYDDASRVEQAKVRTAWDRRATAVRESMNLEREFIDAGRPWTELNEAGEVVRRYPPKP